MDAKKALKIVTETFKDFGVDMEPVSASDGRTALHLVLKPTAPVRMKEIEGYEKDLCFALGVKEIIILAPILGTSTIGVDVRKTSERELIPWKDIRASDSFDFLPTPLSFFIGKDEENKNLVSDLAKMPHLLIGGATGGGKSVFLHSLICTLITRNGPETLRLVLIDPKRVEFPLYTNIPHLLTDPIHDAKKSVMVFKWLTKEMHRRFNILEEKGARDISAYHNLLSHLLKQDENQKDEEQELEAMPYILVVVDEFSDLMSTFPREHENAIIELAQMSRAVGIHMVFSSSRPSAKIFTGMIRANIPARLAFQTFSSHDSRSILDTKGAERLLGSGDALFLDASTSNPLNVQTPYISEEEVKECVSKMRTDAPPSELSFEKTHIANSVFDEEYATQDELFDEVVEAVRQIGKASTSFIQRKFGIGYARSARLIDMLESAGVIGPGDGAKPREVIEKEE